MKLLLLMANLHSEQYQEALHMRDIETAQRAW